MPVLSSMPQTKTTPVFDTFAKVISPDRLIRAEQEAKERQKAEEENSRPLIQGLVSKLRLKWQAARRAKDTAGNELGSPNDRLLRCLRQRLGQYEPDKLAAIKAQDRSEIYMLVTNIKCRSAKAWIEDIMLQPDEPVFDLDPTPVPDLPQDKKMDVIGRVRKETVDAMMADPAAAAMLNPEAVQARIEQLKEEAQQSDYTSAKKAAKFQAKKIEDEFQEGGFYNALKAFINDLVTYPAAFIGGPFIRKEKRLTWARDNRGGYIPKIEPKYFRKYEWFSPFDAYPSPGAKNIQDGYFFRRREHRKSDLMGMIGIPGFKEESIRAALNPPPPKEWISTDSEVADIQNRDDINDPDPLIDVLEFWGKIEGRELREWGMSEQKIPDPDKQYDVTAWMIGNWVICARLNPHPLGLRPYHSASYDPSANSIWGGKCPPELMKDVQDIANAAARAAVDNLGIASGPQVGVNVSRMPPGSDAQSIYPWKIWPFEDDPTGASIPPIQFFQPDPIAGDLWKIFEKAIVQAGEQTGIPAFTHAGVGAAKEAGDTASGMAMQMNAAGKVLKAVIREIDFSIIKPIVRDHWTHVMLYDEDEYKIGDVNIIARASEHIMVMEAMQLRLNEFMNLIVNDWDKSIIGDKGRAVLLRERVKALKLPVEGVVPNEEEMERRDKVQQAREQLIQELAAQQQGDQQLRPKPAIQSANAMPDGRRFGENARMAT